MLINCAVYEGGAKLADIRIEDISDHVCRPGRFVWVALTDAKPAEIQELQREFELHPLAVEDAGFGHQRPKIEEYGDSLFAVMHLVEITYDSTLCVGEVNVFVGPNYVLSVRNRSRSGFLGVRERCEREPELLRHGAGFVLYALLDAVVDRYFPVIEALEAELERIELRIFTKGQARTTMKRLYALKQQVSVLKRAVSPLREGVAKLCGGRVPRVCQGTQDYFRDVADHLAHIDASIDSMRDTIGTAMQVNLSMIAIEDGEVTKRLAAWGSIFAVCTVFVGIWGMNFERMPELKWRYGYAFALLVIVTTSSGLYYRFRRVGWL